MNIIKYRNWFFALSLLVIIPGVLAFYLWGLKLGIDFSGGTLWEVRFTDQQQINLQNINEILKQNQAQGPSLISTSQNSITIRMQTTEDEKITRIRKDLANSFGPVEDMSLATVGPLISQELTQKATRALLFAILAIVSYVTWAFRKVPQPASSFAFGICTVVALIHDVVIVVGSFAILGHFAGIEVDSLFITALLTVLGFSVHDTIVVFDRIRENLKKYPDFLLEEVINHSITQTLTRSLNTSLTVVFVLVALLLFGGQSIKTFVLALLIGVISGTYSSIFNAAPLLVVWHKIRSK